MVRWITREEDTWQQAIGRWRYPPLVLLHRIVQDRLGAALDVLGHGVPPAARLQVVNLGCGCDSRPWHWEHRLLRQVHWVDVDRPEVIRYKLNTLRLFDAQVDKEATGKVAFPLLAASYKTIPMDLRRKDVGQALLAGGYSPLLPTLFLMEQVTQSLPKHAVHALHQELLRVSLSGSGLVSTTMGVAYAREMIRAGGIEDDDDASYKAQHESQALPAERELYACTNGLEAATFLREAGWECDPDRHVVAVEREAERRGWWLASKPAKLMASFEMNFVLTAWKRSPAGGSSATK